MVIGLLVGAAVGLFSTAAMWDGPGGALKRWLYSA